MQQTALDGMSPPCPRTQASPVQMFAGGAVVYVLLAASSVIGGAAPLKAAAMAYAVVFTFALTIQYLYLSARDPLPLRFQVALLAYYFGVLASMVLNSSTTEFSSALKFLLAPLALPFGYRFAQNNDTLDERRMRTYIKLLILLPVLGILGQVARQGGLDFEHHEVSIFANRNNAAFYALALLLFTTAVLPRFEMPWWGLLLLLGSFRTLGALFATVLAMIVTATRPALRLGAVLAVSFLAALSFSNSSLPMINRLVALRQQVELLASGSVNLATVTYGALVLRLGTQDLSFLFRLKHWTELISHWMAGGVLHQVLGFGIGSSVLFTSRHLVPHNDYLRFFFECGFVTGAAFVLLIGLSLWQCGRNWKSVPLLAIALYLCSENLTENYAAMLIFYFAIGVLLWRSKAATGHLAAERSR
jgi:hypothetical protein